MESARFPSDQTTNQLHLVVTSRTPRQAVRVQLRTPSDAVAAANRGTNDPGVGGGEGKHVGPPVDVSRPAQLDPSETGR